MHKIRANLKKIKYEIEWNENVLYHYGSTFIFAAILRALTAAGSLNSISVGM